MPERVSDTGGPGFRQAGRLAGVGNTQPTAAIHPFDRMPGRPERHHQRGHAPVRRGERRHAHDLAADMHRQPHRPDPRQAARLGIQARRVVDRDAELVARPAGGNAVQRARVHVRVHPQRHQRDLSARGRQPGQGQQLLLAFDVDLTHGMVQRQRQFGPRLAHAGEDDSPGRHAGPQRPQQLPAAHHVGAGALVGQEAEDRQVVVRLDGIVDGDALHRRSEPAGAGGIVCAPIAQVGVPWVRAIAASGTPSRRRPSRACFTRLGWVASWSSRFIWIRGEEGLLFREKEAKSFCSCACGEVRRYDTGARAGGLEHQLAAYQE